MSEAGCLCHAGPTSGSQCLKPEVCPWWSRYYRIKEHMHGKHMKTCINPTDSDFWNSVSPKFVTLSWCLNLIRFVSNEFAQRQIHGVIHGECVRFLHAAKVSGKVHFEAWMKHSKWHSEWLAIAGGFKYPTWGDDPIWRAYFSNGLVQPPTSWSWYQRYPPGI